MKGMAPVVREYVDARTSALNAEIAQLREQIKDVRSAERGLSAFDVARQYGFVGDAVEWLASLRGERGDQGIPGRDGRDAAGTDGKDGWSPDDLEIEAIDGGRTIVVRLFKDGHRCVQRDVQLNIPLYRGVWKSGTSAQAGDAVTFAGSVWICNEATSESPGTSKCWTLAVKRGRDAQQ